jgi:plastocyanin
MRKITRAPCVAAMLAGLLTATGSLPAFAAQDSVVQIDNFTFAPQRLTVKSGSAVTWVNGDDIPHTVASTTKLFKSQALDTKDQFSFIFTTPGVYEYFCSLHPHMTGTIVVEAVSGSRTAQ